MASFSKNRFEVLLGDDETETDTLGNVKAVQKKEDHPPLSKRDAARKEQNQKRLAVSPPSRRGRDRGDYGRMDSLRTTDGPDNNDLRQQREARGFRGRQFDRHSGTGIHDNEKKINQGWGHAVTAEQEAANDTLSPRDPAAEGSNQNPDAAALVEADVKTLDEYLASQRNLPKQYQKREPRPPNEGEDDSIWRGAVRLERTQDENVYYGGKESATKAKNKNKKEKVYLEINQPAHRTQSSGRGRSFAGDRHGGSRGRQADHVNLLDAHTFPTLGA